MPFTLDAFAASYEYLFHATAIRNLDGIGEAGVLRSTKKLVTLALAFDPNQLATDADTFLRTARPESVPLRLGPDTEVTLTHQGPLCREFLTAPATSRGDFIELLNSLVFFWPSRTAVPPSYAESFRGRNPDHHLRCFKTADVFHLNAHRAIRFCRYNSGAPFQGSASIPRGPGLFVVGEDFDDRPGKVQEVVVRGEAKLPPPDPR